MVPYPFTAVVGMADMALALTLSAISPAIGGVLVRGEKGTAKSTIVRALTALLPPVPVLTGCRFSCAPAAPDPGCPDGPHPTPAVRRPGDGPGGPPDGPAGGRLDGPVGPMPAAVIRPARLVELPVGATEDRVLGSLHLERALAEGVTAYEPGLLAAAHRGLLYVDEVNLLHDHLVDVLLDAAAMGRATVERDGVSVSHPSRFVLVGTMNPEEGELRPQLLDRFGLTVEVAASRDPAVRAEVVRRRLAYESDPGAFGARYAASDAALADRICIARELLPAVVLGDRALHRIAEVCAAFEVDGMRADLVTARAAMAHAAWCGRTSVSAADIRAAARLALPHRRRRNPFDPPGLDADQLDRALTAAGLDDGSTDLDPMDRPVDPVSGEPDDEPDPPDPAGPAGPGRSGPGTAGAGGTDDGAAGTDGGAGDANGTGGAGGNDGGADGGGGADAGGAGGVSGADGASGSAGPAGGDRGTGREDLSGPAGRDAESSGVGAADPYRTRLLTVPGTGLGVAGRRSRAETTVGRTVRASRPTGDRAGRPHLLATLRVAAPHQRARGRTGPGVLIHPADLRMPIREGREGNLILFCVDASGSMGTRQRIREVKAAVLSLLLDAYQRRDKVGLVTFRGGSADLALPPTSSVEAAAARLASLPTGGRTPLAEGLLRAGEALRVEAIRDPRRRPLLVVVTDGRATAGVEPVRRAMRAGSLLAAAGFRAVVVDCESGRIRMGLAGELAAAMRAEYLPLAAVAATALTAAVRERTAGQPGARRTGSGARDGGTRPGRRAA